MSVLHCGRALVASALFLCALSASAATLTLKAAIGRTLQTHPSLRAEAARVAASRQQAALDGLAPPLTLGAELENILGTGAVSGLHAAEATLRLGQVIELGGKRQARQQRGAAEVSQRAHELDRQRLDLVAETTRRFIAVVAAQAEAELAARQRALAAETRAAVTRRVELGVGSDSDLALVEIDVARADLAREHAEHELASARFALASLWGEPGVTAIEAEGDLLALPELPEFGQLAEQLAHSADLAVFATESARIEAEHALARASRRPDLALSAGVRRLEGLDDQALVFSMSVPFGSGERASLAMARAEADSTALDARREAALLEARQRLFAHYQELRHARTEVEALDQRMIPAAERGLALTRAGFDEARYSLLELAQIQRTLLQLQQERLAAAARYHALLATLERAIAATGAAP